MILFPVLLMLFALSMERVERRLRRLSVREHEVAEFLDQAGPDDVASLANDGFPHAFARFHLRRKNRRNRTTGDVDGEELPTSHID